MANGLAQGVSYCIVEGRAIFLDEIADRYFSLSDELTLAFLELAETGQCQDEINHRLIAMGVLSSASGSGPLVPVAIDEAKSASLVIAYGRCGFFDVLRAIAAQRMALARVKRRRLSYNLDRVRKAKLKAAAIGLRATDIERPVRAFELAKLFFNYADRCLPRSIALAEHLIKIGAEANLVVGVTAAPFAAHAWVQVDDIVLNDTVEEVRKYTPVLCI